MDKASKDPALSEVYLHVQLGNDEAKQFYLSNGFEDAGIIKDYYKRIDPPDCYILKKKFAQPTTSATTTTADTV